MDIEQIVKEVSSEMSKEAKAREMQAMLAEFLRRCLSKLAEQDGIQPVAFAFRHSLLGVLYDFSETEHSNGMVRLYTESQLIAAQQRTAAACAKLASNGVGAGVENGCCPNTDWEDGQDKIAEAIRNGDWREYL